MRKNISERKLRRTARDYWQVVRARLTPQEQKSLLLIAALFVFGAIVRWVRATHAP